MGLLNGKTVVVTGAGRGIGRAVAVAAAAEGANVAVADYGVAVNGGTPSSAVTEEVVDRQIHGDPARLMHRPALPQTTQRISETAAQPGDIADISKQPGTGTADHTPTATRDCNLRTRTGTLHSESAFRAGRSGP